MNVSATLLGRLKKLLRVQFGITTGSVTEDSTLGGRPIGFGEALIQSEFRLRLNDWLVDFMKPFPAVSWGEDTTLADVIEDVLSRSKVEDIQNVAVYRAHVLQFATDAFDNAAGQDAPAVPVASRPAVQAEMNERLESMLLRAITLPDLAGGRATILSNVTDRMVI